MSTNDIVETRIGTAERGGTGSGHADPGQWPASTGLAGRPSPARQAWVILTARYLRQLYRMPVVIFMTLIQPIIWLLLFGALFKKVAEIPGFGGGNYITYLTPGVVIMTAMFSATWTRMAYTQDMPTCGMHRVPPPSDGTVSLNTPTLPHPRL